MKYTNKQYASGLLETLLGKPEKKQKEIVRRFLLILTKNRDWSRLEGILDEAEKICLKEAGLKKVYLETPSPVYPALKKEIQKILGEAELSSGKKIFFSAKTNPALFGGVRILIDNELLIDASAKRQLDKIFVNPVRSLPKTTI